MVKLVQTVIDISKMLNTRKYELESNRVDNIFFRYPTMAVWFVLSDRHYRIYTFFGTGEMP